MVHDETNLVLAQMLAALSTPDFPEAVGVLYCKQEVSYENSVYEQIKTVRAKKGMWPISTRCCVGATLGR